MNLEIINIPGNKISDVTYYSKAMVLHIFYELNCILHCYIQGIILVYDITSQHSFDNITKWLQNIEAVSIYTYIYSYLITIFDLF